MRAKIIADVTIIAVLFAGYAWTIFNATSPSVEATNWQEFVSTTLMVTGTFGLFLFWIIGAIKWIHQGKKEK